MVKSRLRCRRRQYAPELLEDGFHILFGGCLSALEFGNRHVMRLLLREAGDRRWRPAFAKGFGWFSGQSSEAAEQRRRMEGAITHAMLGDAPSVSHGLRPRDPPAPLRCRYAEEEPGIQRVEAPSYGVLRKPCETPFLSWK